MPKSPEFSQEEINKQERRTVSDAQLINEGAHYTKSGAGELRLDVPENVVKDIKDHSWEETDVAKKHLETRDHEKIASFMKEVDDFVSSFPDPTAASKEDFKRLLEYLKLVGEGTVSNVRIPTNEVAGKFAEKMGWPVTVVQQKERIPGTDTDKFYDMPDEVMLASHDILDAADEKLAELALEVATKLLAEPSPELLQRLPAEAKKWKGHQIDSHYTAELVLEAMSA